MDDYNDEIEQFLATGGANKRGFSSTTMDGYGRALRLILSEFGDLEKMTALDLRKWLNSHNWGNSTQWSSLCAVRSFLRWRYGEKHPALNLRMKRIRPAPQRRMNKKQAERLLASFNTGSIKGRRDLAIAALLLDSGLRSSELCRLEKKYLKLDERHLTVLIKGGHFDTAVFSMPTKNYLVNWMVDRENIVAQGVGTVFVSISGGTKGHPLTPGGLRAEMRKWAKRAGLEAGLSPHDFRRSFASLSTRRGAPSRVLQVAGRWSNIEMVEHYTQDIEAEDFDPYFPIPGLLDFGN